MYTVDDKYDDKNDEEEYEDNSSWDNRHGLIIKILIIILCVIVLIWLISALKGNKNYEDNGKVHDSNIEKVRLAAEKYFFINGNANDKGTQTITLQTLKNNNLVGDITDSNNKVCNEYNSNVRLEREVGPYEMTIKLDCSTNDKEEKFYYNNNTLACLNCNGKSNMDGNTPSNDDKVIPIDNDSDIDYNSYSCKNWTSWSTNRVYETYLTERTRKLYKGVKYGKEVETIAYSDWSEYQLTPIEVTDNIEVETEIRNEMIWSDPKTTTSQISNSDSIKIIATNTVYKYSKGCPSGYKEENGVCYSKDEIISDLSYNEYNSGKYQVSNGLCEGVKNGINSEGKYDIIYTNCHYKKIIDYKEKQSKRAYTEYTYQELQNEEVTYYRFREKTITISKEDDIYTSEYYEENKLPSGFVKLPSTEKIEYSYIITTCEK